MFYPTDILDHYPMFTTSTRQRPAEPPRILWLNPEDRKNLSKEDREALDDLSVVPLFLIHRPVLIEPESNADD